MAMAMSALVRQLMLGRKRRSLSNLIGSNLQLKTQPVTTEVQRHEAKNTAILITTPDGNAALFRLAGKFIPFIVADLPPASRPLRAVS